MYYCDSLRSQLLASLYLISITVFVFRENLHDGLSLSFITHMSFYRCWWCEFIYCTVYLQCHAHLHTQTILQAIGLWKLVWGFFTQAWENWSGINSCKCGKVSLGLTPFSFNESQMLWNMLRYWGKEEVECIEKNLDIWVNICGLWCQVKEWLELVWIDESFRFRREG